MDRTDFEILRELQNDARISNKELAAKINLAPSTCLERVRRLTLNGVIRGYHTEIEPKFLGIRLQALIAIRINQHTQDLVQRFQHELFQLPEVIEILHMAGSIDFLVLVAVRDAEHLKRLVLESFTNRKEIRSIETSLIFSHEKKSALPVLMGSDGLNGEPQGPFGRGTAATFGVEGNFIR